MIITNIVSQIYTFNNNKCIPRLDLELLLAHSIDKNRVFLIAHPEYKLTTQEYNKFRSILKRRQHYEPIAYILGYKEFYGNKFIVNRSVLIPRPVTENLVDKAIENIILLAESKNSISILEIGTGSGCLTISVALQLYKSKIKTPITILAIDISQKALYVARNNYNTYQSHITDNTNIKIKFKRCNILSKSSINKNIIYKNFDIVISNPPYIKSNDIPTLQADIRLFEPHLALNGGTDGQLFYRAMKENLNDYVTPTTTFILEGMDDKFIKTTTFSKL